jgi:hypothetical protein
VTPITFEFDVANGVRRLLGQPGDVMPREAGRPGLPRAAAPEGHRDLFDDYLNDLRLAYDLAVEWWEGTVEAQEEEGMGHEEAVAAALDARLAGPAAHPSVVYMVRSYWLLCEEESRGSGVVVHPEELLLGWLVEAGEDDLVKLLACMPYWPIGLDAEGRWC